MSVGKLDRYVRDLKRDLQNIEIPQDLRERFRAYRSDPVKFAEKVLQLDLVDYQKAFLRDVANEERVAWVGGHSTGKTVAAAILVIWYLLTRPGCRCVITSATFERQVGRVIFAKIKGMVAGASEPLPLDVYGTRCEVSGYPEWSCEGVPSSKPENFAGFHSTHMLVIADEAKAIEHSVFIELQSVLASAVKENRLVMVSTAGPAQGYFYQAFQRPDLWKLHRVPSTDSPYATGYAERMLEDCLGPDDPVYRMRVLAEFASNVEGQLIPIEAIQAAVGREFEDPEKDERAAIVLGCDIARFGEDQSVIAIRQGRRVTGLKAWRGADTMVTAERIVSEANSRGVGLVFIDEAGVGGGPLDRVKQLVERKDRIRGVNVARTARDDRTFTNLRAELSWRLRERFEKGEIAIPDDTALISELAALRYGYDQKARIKLEPKDEAKSRLGRSPDRADSVMLAYAGDVLGAHYELDAKGFASALDGLSQVNPFDVDGTGTKGITPGQFDFPGGGRGGGITPGFTDFR